MSRIARSIVVLVTVLSMACSGRACGGANGAASQSGGGAASAGMSSDASGTQYSAAELREPLLKAQQELALAMGFKADPNLLSMTDLSDTFEKMFTGIEAAERGLSRDTFDVEAITRRVGTDWVKLFEWVRDNTYLVPYQGVLRGPTGVLLDRFGNSLDRALLLADLLRSAGVTVRFAHATLSSEQAANVVRSARPMPRSSAPRLDPRAEDAVRGYAETHGLDVARVGAAFEQVTAASRAMSQSLERRAIDQAGELAKLLGTPGSQASSGVETAVESFRNHWWIQAQQGAEWIDLDPTVPDATPGRTVASADEVLALSSLPASLYHEIHVRIVVEKWTTGRLQETTVLQHTLRPMELIGQRIVLRHRPLNSPGSINPDGGQAGVQVENALLAQKEWQPVLDVGARTIAQSSFSDPGNPSDSGRARGSIGGFGDLFGGGEDTPNASDGPLTAEWIEYEIRSPGLAAQRIRRDVFDLVGPSARTRGLTAAPNIARPLLLLRAMSLLGETDILPLVSQVSQEFVAHVVQTSLLNQRATLRELLQASTDTNRQRALEVAAKLVPSPGPLYGVALARQAWSPASHDVFFDRPNIISFHRRVLPGSTGGIVRRDSVDIVANEMATRPESGADAFQTRLAQGMTDTAVEALLIGTCGSCSAPESVSELWLSTRIQGTTWVVVRTADDAAWRDVAMNDDARRRVEDDLRAGYVAVVPARSTVLDSRERLGWWRIDPNSGSALGIMDSGEGQGMVEYAISRTAGVLLGASVTVINYASCGGFTPGANTAKQVACFACGLLSGVGMAFWALYGLSTPNALGFFGGSVTCALFALSSFSEFN